MKVILKKFTSTKNGQSTLVTFIVWENTFIRS